MYCPAGLISYDLQSYWSFALLVSCWSTVAGTLIYISCVGSFPLYHAKCCMLKSARRIAFFLQSLCWHHRFDPFRNLQRQDYKVSGRCSKRGRTSEDMQLGYTMVYHVLPCYTRFVLFFEDQVDFLAQTNCAALCVLHSISKFKHVCALFACRILRPWVSLALKVSTGNVAKWQWRFGVSWLTLNKIVQDHH